MDVALSFHLKRLRRRASPLIEPAKLLIVAAAVVWFMTRGAEQLGYNWQWYRAPRYLFSIENGRFTVGPLLEGIQITLLVATLSLILSFVFGLAVALLRFSDSFAARLLARVYLEGVRNTPLLIQIFFIYFVLGPVLGIGRLASAVLALSLFEGAYASEIFRAGIASIHRGQWEAAYSLGLSTFHTYSRVILPQAVRRILPPLTSQGISLIKDSALVSTISIYDLTMRGQMIVAETFLTFEIWFTVAGLYLILNLSLSFLAGCLERRIRIE
jgi:polar amino acid transport system permease protein